LYGIRTIRSYSEATIEKQGKLSSCYEKNISQDATCRKAFVIACTEKVLGGLGLEEVVTVFEKRYLQCLGCVNAPHNRLAIYNSGFAVRCSALILVMAFQ
jgi:hypothetical protein